MSKAVKLNAQRLLFCKEYIIDLNATQAAIRAGYSENTATEQGSRLLSFVNVQEKIQELMDERSKRVEMDADYVLTRYKKIIDDDIRNYLSFDTDELGMPRVHLKKSDDIDTWNITEISIGKDGQFKFKTHCKDDAMRDVGKHLKLFTDKVEHSGEVSMPIINIVSK